MQKKVLSGLFFIILLNLLVKPYYIFGIDAEIQERVGEIAYGNYFALLNFSYLFNILLDFGIANYNTRNIAQNPEQIQNHFYKLFGIRFLLFVIYVICTLALAFIFDYQKGEFYLLGILIVNQFFVAVIQFCRSNFGGLHLFKTDAIISVLDRLLLIIFCSILLFQNKINAQTGIFTFAITQTIVYGLTALTAVIMLSPSVGKLKFSFSKSYTSSILKQAFPYALLIFLMMIYNRVDAIMLERMLPDGDYQAGIYAQGYRFLDAVNMFALLFAGILLPVFAKNLNDKLSLQNTINFSFNLLIGIAVIVSVFGFLFSYEILGWRYTELSLNAVLCFSVLILSFIPVCFTYIFGTALTANGSLKKLNQMAFVGLVLNVILNYILIPKYQASGTAIATLLTQTITAVIQTLLAVYILKLKLSFNMLIKPILIASGMLLAYYFLVRFNMSINLKLLLVLFTGIGIFFALKSFNLKEIKSLFQK